MKISAAKIFRQAAICSALLVSACMTSPYGNYTAAPEDAQKAIAFDAVTQMSHAFPPGKTRLAFRQKTTDGFGQPFLEGLRTTGYAIADGADAEPGDTADKKTSSGAYIAGYTIDDVDDILRLTIYVGQRSITKAYIRKDGGGYAPAGYWVFKE